ncbi:MAG: PAS domain-containing protein, partial [Terriglobales bacterium]
MAQKRLNAREQDSNGSSVAQKLTRIAQLEQEIAFRKGLRLAESKFSNGNNAHSFSDCDEELRRFIDSNIVAIRRSDIQGNVKELNDATVALFGYTREEYLSGAVLWNQMTVPEYRHLDRAAIESVKATGKAAQWEKQYICKDGRIVTVLIGVFAADTTGNDCFSFIFDITDRKRIEAEVLKSEAQFRILAEAIPQIVY